jgi:hypothetical protein
MSADRAALRVTRRVALALVLCLLTVAFAVEAKTAWFGPANGPGIAVSAAKARPADLPRVIDHGVPVPSPVPPTVSFDAPSLLLLPLFNGILRPAQDDASLAAFRLETRFSPQSYFRPPPGFSLSSIAS